MPTTHNKSCDPVDLLEKPCLLCKLCSGLQHLEISSTNLPKSAICKWQVTQFLSRWCWMWFDSYCLTLFWRWLRIHYTFSLWFVDIVCYCLIYGNCSAWIQWARIKDNVLFHPVLQVAALGAKLLCTICFMFDILYVVVTD